MTGNALDSVRVSQLSSSFTFFRRVLLNELYTICHGLPVMWVTSWIWAWPVGTTGLSLLSLGNSWQHDESKHELAESLQQRHWRRAFATQPWDAEAATNLGLPFSPSHLPTSSLFFLQLLYVSLHHPPHLAWDLSALVVIYHSSSYRACVCVDNLGYQWLGLARVQNWLIVLEAMLKLGPTQPSSSTEGSLRAISILWEVSEGYKTDGWVFGCLFDCQF